MRANRQNTPSHIVVEQELAHHQQKQQNQRITPVQVIHQRLTHVPKPVITLRDGRYLGHPTSVKQVQSLFGNIQKTKHLRHNGMQLETIPRHILAVMAQVLPQTEIPILHLTTVIL